MLNQFIKMILVSSIFALFTGCITSDKDSEPTTNTLPSSESIIVLYNQTTEGVGDTSEVTYNIKNKNEFKTILSSLAYTTIIEDYRTQVPNYTIDWNTKQVIGFSSGNISDFENLENVMLSFTVTDSKVTVAYEIKHEGSDGVDQDWIQPLYLIIIDKTDKEIVQTVTRNIKISND